MCDALRMTSRRVLWLGAIVVLVVVVVIGISQAKHAAGPSQTALAAPGAAQISRALAGSPRPLATLHAEADRLLPVRGHAVTRLLASLRGYPVVVNKWASWCVPCRQEFPLFQHAAVDYGRRVAFVGLDSGDGRAGAVSFLARFPVSYPSFSDPSASAGTDLTSSSFYPVTAYFDTTGRRSYVHQGVYQSVADLERDIQRYALAS